MIPMEDEDMSKPFEEEEVKWALTSYSNDRERARNKFNQKKGKGKEKGKYQQARRALQYTRMSRGWKRSSQPPPRPRSNDRNRFRSNKFKPSPKRGFKTLTEIKANSRCHKCKKIGHWEEDCPEKSSLFTANEQFFCGLCHNMEGNRPPGAAAGAADAANADADTDYS